MNDLVLIARLIEALRPWLDDLVIVGGWAHQLHRFHPRAKVPSHAALGTKDADIALPGGSSLAGSIGNALKEAGFQEELSGEDVPPISQYRLGAEDSGFYAEFLIPLIGSGYRRDGSPDATVGAVGVTAQKLRYLELLLIDPWTIQLDPAQALPLSAPAEVCLPNPVSFIAQKLLIQKYRQPNKKAQDVLYVHDTLELFGSELEELRVQWSERIRPSLPTKTAAAVAELARAVVEITDPIRSAARIPQDRTLTPERILGMLEYGFQGIFGAD